MKQFVVTAAALLGVQTAVLAVVPQDSLKAIDLQEIQVVSTRATVKTPIAFTNVGKQELQTQNQGKDIPFLLSLTPSVIATSDAGAGIGYTGIRVRGTDPTRINITANGIPLNDAESHSVFWVNMPDFASSIKDIQVQRGAGTSTNGAGAFGASINLQTSELNPQAYAEVSGSAGSFGTHKETVKVGTGLLSGRWTLDARLSNIQTDGYIDRASASLQGFYLQGGYYADNTAVKLVVFGGKERTYHAWNYASKAAIELYGRRHNPCGFMFYEDKAGQRHRPDIDYDYALEEAAELMKNGAQAKYYDGQTDNYAQTHFQFLVDHRFDNRWKLNAGLHYTLGEGYYQEYKRLRKPKEYRLTTFNVDGKEVKKVDLVRKKSMDNGFGGAVFALNYRHNALDLVLGGGLNRYTGHHFGQVVWMENYVGRLEPDHEYYRNKATKDDGNLYLKGTIDLTDELSAYADLQYRSIRYRIHGDNDKWDFTADKMQTLGVDEKFGFFNPKAGLLWQPTQEQRLYGSVSIAHKEPTRNNYTDGKFNIRPKAERLTDFELGYSYQGSRWMAGANFYYMHYKDQLVLTGETNEIGEPLAVNVPKSHRMGVELMAAYRLPFGLEWDANATLSRNRIHSFTEMMYDGDGENPVAIEHRNTRIAYSPDLMFNNRLVYRHGGWEAALYTKYVGKQYLSNLGLEAHALDAYFVNDLSLAYTFKCRGLKSCTVGCTVYNLLNEQYESNGYAGSYYLDAATKERLNWAGYAVQAGTHFMAHATLRF